MPAMMVRAQRKVLNPKHGPCDAFDGSMVLLDDIIQVLRLAQRNGQTAVGLDADDGGRVGAAPVDNAFLGHIVSAASSADKPRTSAHTPG